MELQCLQSLNQFSFLKNIKIKNIALLFLLVSSFAVANEKNKDSEELTLYPKNIIEDPFASETYRISGPSGCKA